MISDAYSKTAKVQTDLQTLLNQEIRVTESDWLMEKLNELSAKNNKKARASS